MPSNNDHHPPRGRAGMREVADRAGVAMSSVSRVLSGHPDVSPQMRVTVLKAVDEIGYRPDMLAQGLRSRRTLSIGFTVSEIANPVMSGIVTGAEKRLRAAGYSLLLTDSEGNPDLDVEQIHLLEQRRVDGLVLALADEHHPGTVRALQELDLPVVLLDRDVPAGVDARVARFDHYEGMSAATSHLLDLGHRNFALIVGGPRLPARERRRGVDETLERSGTGATCTVFDGEFSSRFGSQAVAEMMGASVCPTAIIAGGNLLMEGALRELHRRNVRVGAELSFVGCDDVALAELHDPPIAVVDRDVQAIGAAAADLLLTRLADRGDEDDPRAMDWHTDVQDVVLPTHFVRRASCAPAPTPR